MYQQGRTFVRFSNCIRCGDKMEDTYPHVCDTCQRLEREEEQKEHETQMEEDWNG